MNCIKLRFNYKNLITEPFEIALNCHENMPMSKTGGRTPGKKRCAMHLKIKQIIFYECTHTGDIPAAPQSTQIVCLMTLNNIKFSKTVSD